MPTAAVDRLVLRDRRRGGRRSAAIVEPRLASMCAGTQLTCASSIGNGVAFFSCQRISCSRSAGLRRHLLERQQRHARDAVGHDERGAAASTAARRARARAAARRRRRRHCGDVRRRSAPARPRRPAAARWRSRTTARRRRRGRLRPPSRGGWRSRSPPSAASGRTRTTDQPRAAIYSTNVTLLISRSVVTPLEHQVDRALAAGTSCRRPCAAS